VTPAAAVDFDLFVHAWTNTIDGQNGTDGNDEAGGIVLDSVGNVIAVGWLDGAEGHGTDGYMVAWNPDGTIGWEIVEDVGEIGVDRATSSDRLYSIQIDQNTGDYGVCGRRGAEAVDDPEGRFWIERYTKPAPPFAPVLDWSYDYTYGPALTSPIQECFGISWERDIVVGTGWGFHSDAKAGAWITLGLTEVAPIYIAASSFFDFNDFPAVPDQAYDVEVDSLTGNIAVVGTRGFSGLVGASLNDTDWHVQYLDPTGALLWEDTQGGASFLDDRAQAVAIDLVTQDLFVAGWINSGTDNLAGADLDWVVIRYDDDGDGFGGPAIVWTTTWESAEGASEGATAVELDEEGDPLVAGWAIDALTGREVWRLAKLTAFDGSPGQEWLGPAHGGDSRPTAIAYDGNAFEPTMALAGYISNGADRDFAAVVLDFDTDEDGTADVVDACPDDPLKAADEGICGCDIPDVDTDKDGVFNCLDGCPTDPNKTDPGVCDCENADTDSDGDGAEDCIENCDDDPYKTDFGECGCGNPDNDTDGDGVLGCRDACANTPPDADVDQFGCPLPEGPDDTDDEGGGGSGGGCGCAGNAGSPAGAAALLSLLISVAGRRRRHTISG
jgi:MYXO-CTERM domain-containing protein